MKLFNDIIDVPLPDEQADFDNLSNLGEILDIADNPFAQYEEIKKKERSTVHESKFEEINGCVKTIAIYPNALNEIMQLLLETSIEERKNE